VALEAIGRSLRECRSALATTAAARLHGKSDEKAIAQATDSIYLALVEVRSYLSTVEMDSEDRASERARYPPVAQPGGLSLLSH
jgi:hypothetical protein